MVELNRAVLTTGAGWMPNNGSIWPQTIYQMYQNLSNNLAGENPDTAAFEMQARSIIGACLGKAAHIFIKKYRKQYYNEAKEDETIETFGGKFTREQAAINVMWDRLAFEALELYNKKTSGDGYLCKTAVTWIPPNVKVECLQPAFDEETE
jgi:hypothetical protein